MAGRHRICRDRGVRTREVIAPDGTRKAFLAELNPRVNGATYRLAIHERLSPRSAFVCGGSDKTRLDALAEVRDRLAPTCSLAARGLE